MKAKARILHTRYGEVALPLILDVDLSPIDEYTSKVKQDTHEHYHHHCNHLENNGFFSVSFDSDRPFDIHNFETFIADYLPQNVFRAQGLL